jgi:hypothetical protein
VIFNHVECCALRPLIVALPGSLHTGKSGTTIEGMEDQLPPPPDSNGSRNGIAVAGFVFGLISVTLFLFGIFSLAAIALSGVGWWRGVYGAPHRGLAGWGLVIGILSLGLLVVFPAQFLVRRSES